MYELYIKNEKVDLPQKFSILWTFNSTDLNSPAAIKNSFSKQIELKGTPRNNRVFNFLYKTDSDYSKNFDPNIRNEFVLTSNGVLIESGYVQLNKITRTKSDVTYSITLFGGLGDFFYNLDSDENGTKKTLSSLYWRWLDAYSFNPYWYFDDPTVDHSILSQDAENNEYIMDVSPKTITLAWKELALSSVPFVTLSSNKYTNVRDDIIFMPFDTGAPDIENFEPNKLLINEFIYNNSGMNNYWKNQWNQTFPSTTGGVTYYSKDVTLPDGTLGSYILTEAARDITQIESGALIATQMVPAFRIKKFLDVIADPENNGGYKVEYTDKVLDNAVVKDGYNVLDRIKTDEFNAPLIVSDDTQATLTLNTAYPVSEEHHASDLYESINVNFLAGQNVNISNLETFNINKLNWAIQRDINTDMRLLIGGYPNNAIYEEFGSMRNAVIDLNLLYPYSSTEVFDDYGPEDGEGTITRWFYKPVGVPLNITGTTHVRVDMPSNDGTKRCLYTYSEDERYYMTINPNTIGSILDSTAHDNIITSPVSYRVENSLIGASIYLNILRVLDVNDSKEIVYVVPYIIANNVPYRTDAYDETTYINNVPSFIHNWITSSQTKSEIEAKINSIIAEDGRQVIATHIFWDNIIIKPTQNNYSTPITLGTPDMNIQRNAIRNVPRGTSTSQQVATTLCYDNTVIAYHLYSCSVHQRFDISSNFDIDFIEWRQLGNSVHMTTDYLWVDAERGPYATPTTFTDASVNNHPLRLYAPVTFYDCKTTNDDIVPKRNTPSYMRPTVTNPWNVQQNGFYMTDEVRVLGIFEASAVGNDPMNAYIRKSALFNNSNSPYEYFISLSKLLNWKFDYDSIGKKITVMTNEEFYNIRNTNSNNLTVDYSKKVEITPYLKDVSNINISFEPIDSYANYLFNRQTNSIFNSIDIPTTYKFNNKTENILDKAIFKSASEYIQSSAMFHHDGPYYSQIMNLGSTKLYRYKNKTDNDYEPIEIIRTSLPESINYSVVPFDYPILNCYDNDYGYVSPKNTIVLFNGFVNNIKIPRGYASDPNNPVTVPVVPVYFGVTAHNDIFNILNENNACYINDYYDYNSMNGNWCKYTRLSVWPTDIPVFSLHKFLQYDNAEVESKSNSLLFNQELYYPINRDYTIQYRIKSTTNTQTGHSNNAPMTLFPTDHFVFAGDPIPGLWYFTTPSNYSNVNLGNTLPVLNAFANNCYNQNHYLNQINSITDQNARQIKVKAKLNTSPKNALRTIYEIDGAKYVISKIENYDVSDTNPFADITLQKIV